MGKLQHFFSKHFFPKHGFTHHNSLRYFISKVMVLKDYLSKTLKVVLKKFAIQTEIQRIFKKKRQNFVMYRMVFWIHHNLQLCFLYLFLISSPNFGIKKLNGTTTFKKIILQFFNYSSFHLRSMNAHGFDFLSCMWQFILKDCTAYLFNLKIFCNNFYVFWYLVLPYI